MSLDKCIMTCIHHYNTKEYFHCPKNLLCSTYSSLPIPYPLGKILTLSIVLPFPDVGIIQYVAILVWFLSLNNMHLRLLYGFFFFFFWPCPMACRILVPRSGIEPKPSAVKAQSPNHWTAREFPRLLHVFSCLDSSLFSTE